jgi:alpha-glucosidase
MNLLGKIILGLRNASLSNSLRSLRYALYRDRLERRYLDRQPPTLPRRPGKLLEARPAENGASFKFEGAELEILFLAPDLARLSWGPGLAPIPYALAGVDWPQVEVKSREADDGYRLESETLHVDVSLEGKIQFLDSQGRILRTELPPEKMGAGWVQQADLVPEERIYGLGEQAAPMNRRGASYRMWNSDPGGRYGPGDDPLYIPLPVYMGLHSAGSYLVFYENPFPASFEFDPPADRVEGSAGSQNPAPHARVRFEAGLLRVYFTCGPPRRLLERYTQLTGRPPLPPRWSLGYHQCRWGYKTSGDIRQVAAGFREHQMPISAIHLDIDYMDGYRVFSVNREAFPDLPELAGEMASQGIRLVTILDPGVKQDPEYGIYREALEKDLICKQPDGKPLVGLVWPGWALFPDFTDPQARLWWGEQYQVLLAGGIAGFWHDMNEPSSFAAWGDISLPLVTRHCLDGEGGTHHQAHNLYGLLMNRAGYEGLRQARPEKRPWILSRSGWAGNQRFAWNWTGDMESTWEGLRLTVSAVLGMGLSGLAYTGPDIGGFSGNPDAELYLRWFQMAAFLPFFRTHSAVGTARREPWVYGEPYTGILRQYLKLRCRLLPYLYTLTWECSQTGWPLVRPLWWDDPEVPELWDLEDAFLLGDALLIAPILEKGARRREVICPPGKWYSFWDGKAVLDPEGARLEAPLERIPILVRGGSLLPLEEDGRMSFHLYPGNGYSRLYLDAGDGYGGSHLSRFELKQLDNRLELAWEREGEYVFPDEIIEVCLHGPPAQRAWVDGQETPIRENRLETRVFQYLSLEIVMPE